MEEKVPSRGKSILRIVFYIMGMLLFGGLGFYFGIQDTFKIKKEPTNKQVINPPTQNEVEIETDIYNEDFIKYDQLINKYSSLIASTQDKKELSSLTSEDIISVLIQTGFEKDLIEHETKEYTEEELESLGILDNTLNSISIEDLNNLAKEVFNIDAYNGFIESIMVYGIRFELNGNRYEGYQVENLGTKNYIVKDVIDKGNEKVLTLAEVTITSSGYYQGEELIASRQSATPSYMLILDENNNFISVEKL